MPVLADRYHLDEKTIRTRLDAHTVPALAPTPRSMVAVMDATHTGSSWLLVVRDPNAHENVYYREIMSETTFDYQQARDTLTAQGFHFCAIVADGRALIPWLFPHTPLQMCHFHQEQIVIRCLTLQPKLPAGQELLDLVKTLPHTDEDSFTDAFKLWCRTWSVFLKEKTVHPETGRWSYTHKRLRQARDSINHHVPYLFTYQKYPELHIPNTTNSLDGSFKKVKLAVAIHSGLTHARRMKLITTLLSPRA